jgi:single-strand DNA-binding protein
MKNIVIAGTVGRDAQTRSAGERKVTGWSVAVDDGWGDKKTTLWFDCDLWGVRGEKLAQYITKGGKITVSGSLSTREYEGKTKLTVEVTEVELQGGKQNNGGGASDRDTGGYGNSGGGSGYGAGGRPGGDMDDSIPFQREDRA